MLPLEVTPQEVKQKLDAGETVHLIDVREPHEHRTASIDGAELIPMRSVPQSLAALKAKPGAIVVFCHHGMRSMQTVSWLRRQGLDRAQNMAGGIDAWSASIDPKVPRY
jgi:rhodanese-related sulfurtransferase